MKLIVGLGNPGEQYENTRHNIGFKSIDAFLHAKNIKLNKKKFTGEFYKGDNYIIAKPLTFMNLSGNFVQSIIKYFDIEIDDILVIYDDMDLKPGNAVIKPKGSAGGQKGMKDIIEKLGTHGIARMKIGIGKANNESVGHVLGVFSKIQLEKISPMKSDIVKAIDLFIDEDIHAAMNFFNTKY